MSHDTLNLPVAVIDIPSNTKNIYAPLAECEHEGDELLQGRSIDDMRSMTPEELLKLPAFHPYCIDGHVLTCTFNDGVRAGLTDDYDFLVTYTADHPLWSDVGMFKIMADLNNGQNYEPAMRAFFGENSDRAMKLYPFNGNADEFVNRISYDRYAASVMMLAALRKNSNTWLAEFDHVTPGPEAQKWGAFHTSDVPYWLDYFYDKRKDFWREDDYALGQELVTRLAAFAKTGRPEAENLASWNPSDGNSLYRIDAENMQKVCPLDEEKYQFWRDFYCVN